MLSKLLKYEYRATAKILLPLYLGVLFVIMLNVLVFRIGTLCPVLGSGTPYTVIQVLLTFLCGLGLLAVLAVSFFMGIQRFYSLLGTRGYLMFSLPVTTNQLIASKLICAVSWMTASFLLCNILFRMIGLPTEGSDLVIAPMGETPPLFVNVLLCIPVFLFLHCDRRSMAAEPAACHRGLLFCNFLPFAAPADRRNDGPWHNHLFQRHRGIRECHTGNRKCGDIIPAD